LDLVTLQQAPGARNAKRLQKDEKRTAIDNLLTKHVLLGCALRLLLLPLQLEIELLLALHSLQMKAIPIGVSTGDAKTKCAREVKPEPLPEFSGDGCDGHRDVEVSCISSWSCTVFR